MTTTGTDFIIQTGDSQYTVTIVGSGNFTLTFDGETTGNIADTDDGAAVETALEALSNITAGDVSVSGAAGGPYTITVLSTYAGTRPTISGTAVTLTSVTVANAGLTNITTLAAGRTNTINRGTDEADLTSKDSNGYHEGLPTIRNWSFDFTHLLVESDASLADLENAYTLNLPLQVRMQTPAGNNYRGVGHLTSFNWEGPHDDMATASGTITGTGSLTKE